MTTDACRCPSPPAVGVTGTRIRALSPAARGVHRVILRAFASTGRAPDAATLVAAGHDAAALLRELHDRDVVRLDEHGGVRAAYPFSAVPTAHTVVIAGGPTVYAMCAIDALGIADMLGRAVTITSTDPAGGEPIRVSVADGRAVWEPDTTVVLNGADTCGVAAADRCCGVMNFFTGTASADSWLTAHPHVTGVTLAKEQALRLGIDIFGHLLDD